MKKEVYSTPQLAITSWEDEVFLSSSFEGGDNIANPGNGWGSGTVSPPGESWTGWH